MQLFNANTLPKFVLIILPILIAFILSKVLKHVIRVPQHIRTPRVQTYEATLQSVLTFFIYAAAFYFIFTNLNIDLTPVFASAGLVGIIIGFGLQPIFKDFFTALFILTEDTLRIGDFVQIDNAEGWVESVDFRAVKIRDSAGAIHIFPNGEIQRIVNYSRRNIEIIVDIPVKYQNNSDNVLKTFGNAFNKLLKEEDIKGFISDKESAVAGIQEVRDPENILIRTIFVGNIRKRSTIGRRFRYLVLKEFEKEKVKET